MGRLGKLARPRKRVIMEASGESRGREEAKEPQNDFSYPSLLLVLLILAAYAPFFGTRYARTAGDDKVYVAQALEMERDGRFFVQTLADQPDYRKGPFHYLALRLGMKVFGRNMWATIYMNLVMVVLGALAVAQLAGRHLGGDPGWAFWSGAAFALNAGIYSHVFASQMEVELASVFALALLALDYAGRDPKKDWLFWLAAGVAGTIKAPLHSVLLGATGMIFWYADGTLGMRLRSARAWLGFAIGAGFCILAYLPPVVFDFKNFMETFFGRENFEKGANGAPWHYPVIPIFTYSLLPWMFAAFVAYADGIRRLALRIEARNKGGKRAKLVLTSGHERLVMLGVALMVPSIVFFLVHAYRGQNYHLPVIPGLILMIAALWATATNAWKRIYVGAIAFTGFVILLVPVAVTILCNHFRPMPDWWWDWTLPCLWVGALLTAKGFWDECFLFNLERPAALARRAIWIFLALSVFMVNIGEREMIDLKAHYESAKRSGRHVQYAYYNLNANVWSEWGYLNFWAGVPVTGMHTEADLKAAALRGDSLLIPGDLLLKEFFKHKEALFPQYEAKVVATWRRWHTKGKNFEGEPVWHEAWRTRNLGKLEKKYFIVEVKPPNA